MGLNFWTKLMFVVVFLMFVVVILSSLAFLIMAERINLMKRCLLHWIICVGGDILLHTPIFVENSLSFWVVLSVPQAQIIEPSCFDL